MAVAPRLLVSESGTGILPADSQGAPAAHGRDARATTCGRRNLRLAAVLWLATAFPLWVGAAPDALLSKSPSLDNPKPLAYAAAPPDNPLKGFVNFLSADPTFPHSLEWA